MKPLIGITCTSVRVDYDPPWRVVGVMDSYIKAVMRGGGTPLLVPIGIDASEFDAILPKLDGLLFPGGGDVDPACYAGQVDFPKLIKVDPQRDALELNAVRRAIDVDKPFLAICRGHQVLNVALGGSLYEDIATRLPDAVRHDFFEPGLPWSHQPHTVTITPNSRLSALLGRSESPVNSLHHQSIRQVADDLLVSAVAPDGVIEAAELPNHRFGVSVQWHPEQLIDTDAAMLNLFRGLVEAA